MRYDRKLIQSNRAYQITIPKEKVINWNLKKGALLKLDSFEDFIIVYPKKENIPKINLNFFENLIKYYRLGYEKVILNSYNEDFIVLARKLKSLPYSSYEIRETDIIIRFENLSFEKNDLKRLFFIFERILFYYEKKNYSNQIVLKELNNLFFQFERQFNLVYRSSDFRLKQHLFIYFTLYEKLKCFFNILDVDVNLFENIRELSEILSDFIFLQVTPDTQRLDSLKLNNDLKMFKTYLKEFV